MDTHIQSQLYRIDGIRTWESEGTDAVPEGMRTFFEGKDVTIDDLRALVASFDATFESAVEGAARYQATMLWRGRRYDLDLSPVP